MEDNNTIRGRYCDYIGAYELPVPIECQTQLEQPEQTTSSIQAITVTPRTGGNNQIAGASLILFFILIPMGIFMSIFNPHNQN